MAHNCVKLAKKKLLGHKRGRGIDWAKTVGSRVRTTVVRWCDFNFYDFRNMQFRVSLVYDQKKSAVRSGSNASQGVQISYSFRELRLTITTILLKALKVI